MADPFACFGDEDSDATSDVADEDDGRAIARQLIDKSNCYINKDPSHAPNNASRTKFTSSFKDQQKRTSQLPWPTRPPLYLGPIYLDSLLSEGGGCGYVASQDLPPGMCVLIEEPLIG